ncbi:MAG TPA: MBL fold metallo-hydrolase [Gaiellaceae bacterium]|jgi:glyoxylase-like metal-dependent hydrolase (beta-lactamase superfamily II)|nr:MBL fold metallo-hydrolase [Gaiellaceae bacterium]
MEIAPGIHRIESSLGVRFMAQYLLVGEARRLLVDTGLEDTPAAALRPYLASIGLELEAVDDVVISHADLDHSGGNRALRALHPRARFACHELDRRWIESNHALVAENYLWHVAHGFADPGEAGREELIALCGGDAPIDEGLRGGETIRLADDWRVEILHLPGHTLGHLGVWDPRSRAAIAVDAVLERGIYANDGRLLIPPRIYDLAAYRETIAKLRALEPELLLTAHYPVMEGAEARAFLDRSLEFTFEVEEAVRAERAAGTEGLLELTRKMDARFGPYPEFADELAAMVHAVAAG